MEYDGKSIADSQFCVEYIKKKRGVDASKDLSPGERGIARAFQKLTEENLYWYLYTSWNLLLLYRQVTCKCILLNLKN